MLKFHPKGIYIQAVYKIEFINEDMWFISCSFNQF